MSGELSHFEQESSKTPVKQPYAIIVGAVVLGLVLWALNHFAPNEALKEAKEGPKQEQVEAAPAAKAPAMDEDEL